MQTIVINGESLIGLLIIGIIFLTPAAIKALLSSHTKGNSPFRSRDNLPVGTTAGRDSHRFNRNGTETWTPAGRWTKTENGWVKTS